MHLHIEREDMAAEVSENLVLDETVPEVSCVFRADLAFIVAGIAVHRKHRVVADHDLVARVGVLAKHLPQLYRLDMAFSAEKPIALLRGSSISTLSQAAIDSAGNRCQVIDLTLLFGQVRLQFVVSGFGGSRAWPRPPASLRRKRCCRFIGPRQRVGPALDRSHGPGATTDGDHSSRCEAVTAHVARSRFRRQSAVHLRPGDPHRHGSWRRDHADVG